MGAEGYSRRVLSAEATGNRNSGRRGIAEEAGVAPFLPRGSAEPGRPFRLWTTGCVVCWQGVAGLPLASVRSAVALRP
jgi:hypothetical protein